MHSQLLLVYYLLSILSAMCVNDTECNGLGKCKSGRCECFTGVMGDRCEGKNMCHAEVLHAGDSSHTIYCNMGGDCAKDSQGVFRCLCRSGFSGPHCEVFTCKSDALCHGRGKCDLEDEHTYNGHCNCFHGYGGPDCYHDTCARGAADPMNPYLCNAGGECVALPDAPHRLGHVYVCKCRPGFSGDVCETFSCANGCANGGTCTANAGECTCPHESFKGKDCGIAECGPWKNSEQNLCYSQGQCVNVMSRYMCLCDPPHTGQDCSSFLCTAGGTCLNEGTCITKGDSADTCACLGAYEGVLCESCRYPNSEQLVGPYSKSMICVPDECMNGDYICNGAGSCRHKFDGGMGCVCNNDAIEILPGSCVPRSRKLNKCAITKTPLGNIACNNKGDCRYGDDEVWRCRCHFGFIRTNDGNCYPLGCVKDRVACSGRGDCLLDILTGEYSCRCGGNYVGDGNTCTLKTSLVVVAIIVPLLIIAGIVGFLCWWFLCHKKSSSRQGRSKAVRLLDGDSLSVQSGTSGFTSQL